MSAAGAIRTRWTVWPLMSMPRMSSARARASAGPSASLTPPALPRPPALTCACPTPRPARSPRPRTARAAPARLPPRRRDDPAARLGGPRLGLLRRRGDHAHGDRDAVLGEQL